MPWVSICIRCARQRESFEPGRPIGQVKRNQIDDLTDLDIERLIWDALDHEENLQTDNLKITSSNGTVTLAGILPSKAQNQSIREIIQDHLGFDDLLEHLEIVEPGTDKFAEPQEPGQDENQEKQSQLQGQSTDPDPHDSIHEDKPMMPPDRSEWKNKR